jgi:hypothetical protein
MRTDVILDYLSHQPGGGATNAGDQLQNLVTAGFGNKCPFNRLNLSTEVAPCRGTVLRLC